MPQYFTNEPVVYVHEGKLVSVQAHRSVELDEAVAAKLGDKVTAAPVKSALTFPKGYPVIDVLRVDPAHDGAHDAHSDKSDKADKKK